MSETPGVPVTTSTVDPDDWIGRSWLAFQELEEHVNRHPLVAWAWNLLRLDFCGIAFGALFFCLSLTPSLMPRTWLFQGLIGGCTAAIGYGIGVVLSKLVLRFWLRNQRWWPLRDRVMVTAKLGVVVVSGACSLAMIVPAARWQREIAALMETQGPSTLEYSKAFVVSIAFGALIISISRVLRDLVRLLARFLIRRLYLSREVSLLIGTAIVVVLAILLFNGVLVRGFFAAANASFGPHNDTTRAGVEQPIQPERSGSPASLSSWESLGFEGRNFVSGGLHANELAKVNGRQAKEPIRVYAGLETAGTAEERVDILVRELERTKAFERKVLVIAPTTGTGWVTPSAARGIELMYNGDTAMVATQYSFLPSWISFLADKEKALASGKLLIGAVQKRWAQQPEGHRPTLLIYGESLGSYAGQGAFDSLGDIRASGVDGVLWTGPPNFSNLWSTLVTRRWPGTLEARPVFDSGNTVRFAIGPDIDALAQQEWRTPRVLFVQHPSDPVTWWSPDLLFTEPDWLKEAPVGDRPSAMRWYPIVTFWQVAADLANAVGVPDGHGHNYGVSSVNGWAAIAAPSGWTPQDTERIRKALDDTASLDGPDT
ncbi:alpha/beta-hydrolase family protein [Mycobacteroides sp. LB1]|uniref:alpha/beta hydrolase n=1 Tax=Mycobacteroides sp. LB1 TaxID=2750814 RepID=UPI0015E019BE|nr:alpha/beta-hydrolase family protein [Mycobacteroides sp. LB1]